MPDRDKTTDANAAFRARIAADQLAAAECAEQAAGFLRGGRSPEIERLQAEIARLRTP